LIDVAKINSKIVPKIFNAFLLYHKSAIYNNYLKSITINKLIIMVK